MSKASGIDKTCPACGALFYVQAYRAEQAKFCSMKCLWSGRPKRVRKMIQCSCKECHATYTVDAYRKDKTSFCSTSCSTKFNAPTRKIARSRANAAAPGYKICTKCSVEKPTSDFWKHTDGFDGLRSKCIDCSKSTHQEWLADNIESKRRWDRKYHSDHADEMSEKSRAKYAANSAEILAKNKKWRDANPEKVGLQNRNKRFKHGERLRAGRREHYRDNSARYKAQAIARMEHIKRATPPWADLCKIEAIYAEAERLSRETGVPHHVDHFYPLRGKTMCGLHVEGNLQILHAVVNLRKSNKVEESGCEPMPPVHIFPPGEISV